MVPLVGTPPGRVPGEALWAWPTGRSSEADPGHPGEIVSPAVLEMPQCPPRGRHLDRRLPHPAWMS